MKLILQSVIIFLFMPMNFSFANAAASPMTCPAFPFFYPKSGPLAAVNCDFHKEYERHVAQYIKTFGAIGGRPVILNLGGTLVLKYNGKTETVNITPINPYHDLKAFLHSVFTIFIVLSDYPDGKLDVKTMQVLHQLYQDVSKAEKEIPALKLSQEPSKAAYTIASQVKNFLNHLLTNEFYKKTDLLTFQTNILPSITMGAKLASKAELITLDNAVNHWLAKMDPKEQKQIGIVVAAAHQARADEISIQYFTKKFNKHVGEGARNEDGLIVLEGKFDEEAALMLLARHYLDRNAAAVMFNDPARLQRDLLADVAREVLNQVPRMHDT